MRSAWISTPVSHPAASVPAPSAAGAVSAVAVRDDCCCRWFRGRLLDARAGPAATRPCPDRGLAISRGDDGVALGTVRAAAATQYPPATANAQAHETNAAALTARAGERALTEPCRTGRMRDATRAAARD